MKVIIIDDEPLARSIIVNYLKSYDGVQILAECNDGFEGIKAIQTLQPDLIFLDILMPKITGFEMLELLEKIPNVIFTTAFNEFAVKAFEINAIDYLLKPFSKERFDKAIEKCLKQNSKNQLNTNFDELALSIESTEVKNRVVVKHLGQIKIIQTLDIIYIEAYDDYVKIHTQDQIYVKKKTMSYFEKAFLSHQFVRVHRSYILQVNQITKIETTDTDNIFAILKNGTKIPLSKTGYPKLKAVLGL